MKNLGRGFLILLNIIIFLVMIEKSALAIDSDITGKTLAKIKGVRVVVEDLQPSFKKYASKFNINQEHISKIIENRLKESGIMVLNYNDWLKTPGRPILYININTHENGKYWFAYDIKFELLQIVFLEVDPGLKTMASTWSVNQTGVLNIGNLNLINHEVLKLTDKFIYAYSLANKTKK
ncbi:MAG TPA: hypothetical protein PKZ54_10180 [Syntrophorhabdaceae bacterium]|nr:hypothetical protein [Syntrophorhabdaceae bacterium]